MILRQSTARWALLALATLAGTAACSGDPGGNDDGGGADGSGGEETDGTGGEETDGSGGVETGGTPSTGGSETGGEGGLGGIPGSGGATGGSGGTPVVFEPITRSDSILIAEADDLRGLFVNSDGLVYASGFVIDDDGDRQTVVLRMTADGELDDTWGDFGVAQVNVVPLEVEQTGLGGAPPVETIVNDGVEESLGVVELSDRSVVVQVNWRSSGFGNTAPTRVGLLKFDDEGTLDTSFGDGGLAPITFGFAPGTAATWSDTSWGIKLDQVTEPGVDKVVVFGFGTTNVVATPVRVDTDRYVTRILADGSVDPTFRGGTAFRYNTTGTLSDGARRGLVLGDGSIVSSGYTNLGDGLGNHVVLIKLTPAGQLDTSFGFASPTAGVAWFNPFAVDAGVSECYGVAVQSSGRLLTTGYGRATGAVGLGVPGPSSLGYLPTVMVDMVAFGVLDAGLDEGWGNDGHLAVQSEDAPQNSDPLVAAQQYEERGRDLVVLPDDRVVYAGRYDLWPALFVGRVNGGLDETVGDSQSGRFVYDDELPLDTSHFYAITSSEEGSFVYATTNYSALNTTGVLLAILQVGD